MRNASITQRVYARIGLLGNPSDSYYGKTISVSLANFFAEVQHALLLVLYTHKGAHCPPHATFHSVPPAVEMQVTLKPCDTIRFAPHSLHDGGQYNSWDGFVNRLDGEGYGGGVRLLKAMCKVFLRACEERNLQLPERYFELSYETNIPRQAGLSGSSAIACAALNCLLMHYDIGDRYGFVSDSISLSPQRTATYQQPGKSTQG